MLLSALDLTSPLKLLNKPGKEYDYCRNLFNQRMIQQDRFVNFKPVLLPLSVSFIVLWFSAVSLPETGRLPKLCRLIVLPVLLIIAYDIATNKSYSLGSPLRDVTFPYWACLIVFRIVDMALSSLWDECPAPQWIEPKLIKKKSPDSSSNSKEKDERGVDDTKETNDAQVDAIAEKNDVEYLWRVVPFPPLFSWDRALYGLDVVLLNRPGTPWLFPWRLRSLEWSLPALNGLRKRELRFGEPEWPLLMASIQQIFHIMAHSYIRKLNLDGLREGGQNLWQVKPLDQFVVTFALGSIIALGNSLEEAITFPLLIRLKILPPTALLGHSRRAILSDGLVELWGYRWHHNWRRSFVRTARLFPAGLTGPGNALWCFFLSGIMHSIMFTRAYPNPTFSHPCTILPIFWEPGIMFFFVSQGIGAVLERFFFPKSSNTILRRLWMYTILIGTGRYLVNSMIVKGWLSAYEWNQMNYPNVLADLFGWRVFT